MGPPDREYLDGMVYADEAKLRRVFHPQCQVVGHGPGGLEHDPLDGFVAAVARAGGPPPGTPDFAEIVSIDVTGDVAVVKLADDHLGARFTDDLTLFQHEGRWLIIHKPFDGHPAT